MKRTRAARVAILHGAVAEDAAPDEQDVLIEVETVQRLLTELGYAVSTVPLSLDLEAAKRRLQRLRPAFVFNLVESVAGLGRLIHLAPALLDSLGLPYTGAGTDATFVTSNKPLAKRLLAGAGIDTPAWLEGAPQGFAAAPFAGPYIVKSVWEHASIGIDDGSITADPRKLPALVRRRKRQFGGDWFAEGFVDGREFNLALLAKPGGVELLPPAEMCFVGYPPGKPRIVHYAAKWDEGSFEYNNTVRDFDWSATEGALLQRLEAVAKDCWRLFGLRGYARVDVRVDAAGRIWVLEVNTNPCISPDAGFAAAAVRAGLSPADVVRRIVGDIGSAVEAPAVAAAVAASPETAKEMSLALS